MYPATKDIMAASGKPAAAPMVQSMVDRMAAKGGGMAQPSTPKPAPQSAASQASPTQPPAKPVMQMDQATRMGAMKRKLGM